MDSNQNIMPEQADVLYSSSSDTSEEQEEEEESDARTANVSDAPDAPLWLALVVGAMYTALAIPVATVIVRDGWHLPLSTWVIGLIIGVLYTAWIVLIVFLQRRNRRWQEGRTESKGN